MDLLCQDVLSIIMECLDPKSILSIHEVSKAHRLMTTAYVVEAYWLYRKYYYKSLNVDVSEICEFRVAMRDWMRYDLEWGSSFRRKQQKWVTGKCKKFFHPDISTWGTWTISCQCSMLTIKGTRCTRNAMQNEMFCFQHRQSE